MSEEQFITITDDQDGQRLDRWLKKTMPQMPYGLAQKLIRKGAIKADGKKLKADSLLIAGQTVRIPALEIGEGKKKEQKLSEKDIAFIQSLVIYEDEHVIAINKPHGLASQGGTKTERHIDGLLAGLANQEGVKPRLVHRLDKDTSGVMLLAKSSKIASALGDSFKGRDVKKIYWALVTPVPEIPEGTISAPLKKAGGLNKERMRIDEEGGKAAITDYAVIDTALGEAAFVAFWPRTGRTHQIRAHAEAIDCPIIGDPKYRKQKEKEHKHEVDVDVSPLPLARRLHLHAQRITLAHPAKKTTLDITAPLPPDLVKSWKALGFDPKYQDDPF